MSFLLPTSIALVTFFAMEGVAWLAHKYLMHGSMWFFHEYHHSNGPGFFEKNDAFFLIFAIPSAYCFVTGSLYADFRFWIGTGIALYGVAYFLVHDVFIHRRFPWFKRTQNAYLMAIRKAHKVHHKHLTKEDGECFGMLFVPPRYLREARKALRSQQQRT